MVSVKKLLAGEGGMTCVKEFLGWTLDTAVGIVTLLERKFKEFLTLVDIPATQRRMGQNDTERLVGKLRSMHLKVPGAVDHLFHIQHALYQGGVDRVWLSLAFHCKLAEWKALALQAAYRPTNMAEIVRREPRRLGFCVASGIGARGMWLDPAGTVHNMVRQNPWPADVTAELVSSTNTNGTITNSYLELSVLII